MNITLRTTFTLLVVIAASASPLAAQNDNDGTAYMKPEHGTLEAIRSAYTEGRDADVVVLADRALLENGKWPGEVHFFRGASLRKLGRPAEALVALDAASKAGFEPAELHLERALALRALGRQQEAQSEMDEARRLVQEDPERRSLLEGRWKSRDDSPRKFEVHVRPRVGWDSNILAVSDDAVLVEEADQESAFYGADLDARWEIVKDGRRSLALEFVSATRAFASEPDLSNTDNTLGLVGTVPLGHLFSAGARVSYAEAFLAEDGHFRTVRSAGSGLMLRTSQQFSISLWGDWSDYDYYLDAPAEQDRDGTSQRVTLSAKIELDGGWKILPGLSFLDYQAEGSDYDRREWQPTVTVVAPAVLGIEPSVSVGYVLADFDNPNSLTGFTEERRDRRLIVTLTLTLRSLEERLGFAPAISVRFEDWDSNVDEFDFTRWQPSIDVSFLAWSF